MWTVNGYVEDDEPVLEGNISVPGTAGEPNGAGLFKGSQSREGVPGGMGSSVGGPREEWVHGRVSQGSRGGCPKGSKSSGRVCQEAGVQGAYCSKGSILSSLYSLGLILLFEILLNKTSDL